MTTTGQGLCQGCLHYRRQQRLADITTTTPPPPACTAFPTGIPAEIFDGSFDHRRPYLGDHGIQYEPRPVTR